MVVSDCDQAALCGRQLQLLALKAALIDSQPKLMNPVTSLSPDPSSPFLRLDEAALNLFLSVRVLFYYFVVLSICLLFFISSPYSWMGRSQVLECFSETARRHRAFFLYCTAAGRLSKPIDAREPAPCLRKHALPSQSMNP